MTRAAPPSHTGPAASTARERDAQEKETGRVEAFSDGVFAIAITLLVLELKVPSEHQAITPALLERWPSYVAFLSSFATIGIMWLNHHTLFNVIRRVDHTLLVLNTTLLLGVTLVPFPTALLAEHHGHAGERVAAAIYSGTFLFVAIVFNLLWRYASSPQRRPTMLNIAHDDPRVMEIHARYRYGPVWYAVSLGVSLWSPMLAIWIYAALALVFALPYGRSAER